MRRIRVFPVCLPIFFFLVVARPAVSQAVYFGIGAGPTFIPNQPSGSKATYGGVSGFLGLEWPSPIGFRLQGTETYGFFWLDAELTYRLASRTSTVVPYGFAGAGLRIDLSESDAIVTGGVGLRAKLARPLSVFGDGRVHYAFSPTSPRTVLLLTFGITVEPRLL